MEGSEETIAAVALLWILETLEEMGIIMRGADSAIAHHGTIKDLRRVINEKKKKGINMPEIMRAFIKYNEEAGHKYPVNYKITD